MPAKQKKRIGKLPKRRTKPLHSAAREAGAKESQESKQYALSSTERLRLYALLAWHSCYEIIFEAERVIAPDLSSELGQRLASKYTARAAALNPEGRQASHLTSMVQEIGGAMQRAKNVKFVPFSQAVKGIFFLATMCRKVLWLSELRARRVVGRQYVMNVLRAMIPLRPPPPIEQVSEDVKFFTVDQTYARTGGSGVGVTKYRAVETLGPDGKRNNKEVRSVLPPPHLPPSLCPPSIAHPPSPLPPALGPSTPTHAVTLAPAHAALEDKARVHERHGAATRVQFDASRHCSHLGLGALHAVL